MEQGCNTLCQDAGKARAAKFTPGLACSGSVGGHHRTAYCNGHGTPLEQEDNIQKICVCRCDMGYMGDHCETKIADKTCETAAISTSTLLATETFTPASTSTIAVTSNPSSPVSSLNSTANMPTATSATDASSAAKDDSEPPPSPSSSSSSGAGAAAGAVVGVLALLGLVAAAVVYARRRAARGGGKPAVAATSATGSLTVRVKQLAWSEFVSKFGDTVLRGGGGGGGGSLQDLHPDQLRQRGQFLGAEVAASRVRKRGMHGQGTFGSLHYATLTGTGGAPDTSVFASECDGKGGVAPLTAFLVKAYVPRPLGLSMAHYLFALHM